MNRVLTGVVAISIVLVVTLFAPDWAFALSIGLVSALAAEEFMSLGATRGVGRPGKWFVVLVGMVGASFIGGAEWVLTSLALSVLVLLTVTMFTGSMETALGRSAIGLGAVLYCGFTLGFVVMLPRELVLLLVGIVSVGDSAAYYGGRSFGRHAIAPKISPKKTVEGAIVGLAGSMLAGGIAGVFFLGEPS